MIEVDSRILKIEVALNSVNLNILNIINNASINDSFSDIFLLVSTAFKPLKDIELSINNYNDLSKRIKKEFKVAGLDISYNKDDVDLLNSLSSANLSISESIRREYESQISSLIYSSKLSSVDDVVIQQQASALIIPNTKITGRSLKSVLDTEVETFVMDTDATLMLKKGNEAGINTYKYIGSLIKDSRPWCINHINKTLTLDQIKEWNNLSWKGKKSGNPFVTRGGWRCRHHFAPIIN